MLQPRSRSPQPLSCSGSPTISTADGGSPGRVGEGLLGLQAQAAARHHPAYGVNGPGRQQRMSLDHRQQRLAAARLDGGEDVGDLRLASRDGAEDGGDLGLVGAQLAGARGAKTNGFPTRERGV